MIETVMNLLLLFDQQLIDILRVLKFVLIIFSAWLYFFCGIVFRVHKTVIRFLALDVSLLFSVLGS